jgi:hypothetical protein
MSSPNRWTVWIALALVGEVCSGQTNVLTYHNDNARTGQNLTETILTAGNVKAGSFGKLFEVKLDGKVDAQPLHVGGLRMPNGIMRDVVFAATEHDSVYAFDADNGHIYWHANLLRPGETTSDARGCDQITPEIGITATPVIDRSAGEHGTMYVLAMSKNSSGIYYHRLHALDISTGAEEFGGPAPIQASYPGSGANASNGRVAFDPKQYASRPGLLLLNGVVYTGWGSHCDIDPYTGWLIGYDRLTLRQTSVFNFAPNGSEAALWNSGGAPAADAEGNIFVAVANGTFDTELNAQRFPNRGDYGNAFVKLALRGGALTPVDYWTMDNSAVESNGDVDLGSGGIMLLPDVRNNAGTVLHLAVGAGKDQNLYVLNRDNLGKFDSKSDGTIYQQLTGALSGGIWGNPAYFNERVYFGPVGSEIEAFEIGNARLERVSVTSHSFGYPGVTPSISANGNQNGILWAIENDGPAVLRAYNAMNLAQEYYNSGDDVSGRDQFGPSNKFVTPTIALGEAFVGTTDSVSVFGLRPRLALPSGEYTVANQLTNLVLDDTDYSTRSGTQIQGWTPTGAANQKWRFTANGRGYYTIRNGLSGLCLTDPGGSRSAGAKLLQETANGSDAQLWSLSISGSGYVIRNKASGLVMDDTGYSFKPGTPMQLWTVTGNSDETWLIY